MRFWGGGHVMLYYYWGWTFCQVGWRIGREWYCSIKWGLELVFYFITVMTTPLRENQNAPLRWYRMFFLTLNHGDIVVPSHRTDWGLRSFAVAGPSSWNALPVGLRSSSFGLDTFAKHLKTHLFGLAYSRQGTHFWVCITFCRVRHGDSVTKPDYYYYYYYYYY